MRRVDSLWHAMRVYVRNMRVREYYAQEHYVLVHKVSGFLWNLRVIYRKSLHRWVMVMTIIVLAIIICLVCE